MIKNPVRLLALAASFFTAVAPAGADDAPVKLTTALTAERELAFQVAQDITIRQQQADVPESTERFAHAAIFNLKVLSVQDDQTARLSLKVSDVAALLSTAGRVVSYKGSTNLPVADPEALGASASDEALDSVMKAILDCAIEFEVDASGQVLRMKGLEPALEAMGAQEAFTVADKTGPKPDPRALGFMTIDNLSELLTRVLSVEGVGTDPRNVGSGWQTTRSVKLPPVGVIEITNNWTLASHAADTAAINGDFAMDVKISPNASPDVPTVTITEQTGGTTIQWNTADNALKSRTTTQKVATDWRLASGNFAITQIQDFKLTIERK